MSNCDRSSAWKEGVREAAQILAYYPNAADYHARRILDLKRKELLALAGDNEHPAPNPRRIGDGVTAEMWGAGLQLSVQDGDCGQHESLIVMSKGTCVELWRYIRQHVLCNEEA